jgi:RNA polymerase sigma factor (sigma-70 family)
VEAQSGVDVRPCARPEVARRRSHRRRRASPPGADSDEERSGAHQRIAHSAAVACAMQHDWGPAASNGLMADIPQVSAETAETDAARIDRAYREHAADTRRLAYLLTGDLCRSDDVAQEAFVRLFGSIGGVRDESALPAYLRRTVVNLVRSQHRSSVREAGRISRQTRLEPRASDSDMPDEAGSLWLAVLRLPDRQRAAVVLRYWLDLADDDIAATLGCRPATVRSLLARAVAELRKEDLRD